MATVHQFPERRTPDGAVFEPWVDEHKVAGHFAVSQRTVRRWRQAGCPSANFAGRRRYRLGEVEAWLRTQGRAAS